jgi:RNA polymerase sigma-70 factor (ECF subfamily)
MAIPQVNIVNSLACEGAVLRAGEINMPVDQGLSKVVRVDFVGLSQQHKDVALVAAIAHGDRSAMQALFNRYQVSIYRFALRLTRNRESAEDIVSEVFLEVWRHADRYEGRSRVSTWLLAIARNLACSAVRRRQTESLSATDLERLVDSSDTPDVLTFRSQQRTILARCLNELSPAHREVIDLVYYHEKTVGEVAEIIGIPQATVKTRMHYARLEIAKLLRAHRQAGYGRAKRRPEITYGRTGVGHVCRSGRPPEIGRHQQR